MNTAAPSALPRLTVDPIPDANGFCTLRPFDGSANGNTEAQPVATVYESEHAARLAALSAIATDPAVANARTLYAGIVASGRTLTGDAARLALNLGRVLAAIDGQEPDRYMPRPDPVREAAPDLLAALQTVIKRGYKLEAGDHADPCAAIAKATFRASRNLSPEGQAVRDSLGMRD